MFQLTDETRQDFNIKQEIGEDIEIGEEYLGSELPCDYKNDTSYDSWNDSIENNLHAVGTSSLGADILKIHEFSMKYSDIYDSDSKLIKGYTDVLYRKFQEINPICVLQCGSKRFKASYTRKRKQKGKRKLNTPDVSLYTKCKYNSNKKYTFVLFKSKDRQSVKGKIIESNVKCLHPDNTYYQHCIGNPEERLENKPIINESACMLAKPAE